MVSTGDNLSMSEGSTRLIEDKRVIYHFESQEVQFLLLGFHFVFLFVCLFFLGGGGFGWGLFVCLGGVFCSCFFFFIID